MGRLADDLLTAVTVSDDPSSDSSAKGVPSNMTPKGRGGETVDRVAGVESDKPTGSAKLESAVLPAPPPSSLETAAQAALAKLKPPHQRAVEAYTNPSSPTYGNKARSWQVSHPTAVNIAGASTSMQRLLKTAEVQPAYSALLEQHRLSRGHRTERLREVVYGEDKEEVYNADGEVVRTIKRPVHRDAMKAIDMLNKLDGSYAQAEQAVNVQAEAAKALIKANAHLLQDDPG